MHVVPLHRFFYISIIILLASASVNAENAAIQDVCSLDSPNAFNTDYFTSRGFMPVPQNAGLYSQFATNTFFYIGQNDAEYNSKAAKSGIFIVVPSNSAAALQYVLESAMTSLTSAGCAATIVCTGGDVSELPDFYQKNIPAGLKSCAATIDPSGSYVYLLTAETKPGIVIDAGNTKKMAPYQMLRPLTDNFSSAELQFSFSAPLPECYYLQWVPRNRYLDVFTSAGIPTLSVSFGTDVTNGSAAQIAGQAIARAIQDAAQTAEQPADMHYLFAKYGDTLVYITEPMLIRIVVYACLSALFIICMSAVVKKRKVLQKRTAALVQIWWIVPLYFSITAVALIMSKLIVLRFSIACRGNQDIWSYAPVAGIVLHFLFTALLLSLVSVIEQLSYFPDRPDVYGYLGSIAAFVNLVIFMSIQFSLAPFFVWMYVCSYVVYHCKKRRTSIFWLICMYVPPIALLISSISNNAQIFSTDVSAATFARSLLLACMLLPLELNIARIKAFTGKIGKGETFRVPAISGITAAAALLCCIFIWNVPTFTSTQPQHVHIGHMINGQTETLTVASPYMLPDMQIKNSIQQYTVEHSNRNVIATFAVPFSSPYFTVSAERKIILERSIISLSIERLIPDTRPLRYQITVINKNGTAVYDASIPYTLSDGGQQCTFMPGENPPDIFTFEFSSNKTDALIIQVDGLFSVPPGTTAVLSLTPVIYTEIIDSVQTVMLEAVQQ